MKAPPELPPPAPQKSLAFLDTLVGIVREHEAYDAWHAKGRNAFTEVLRKACWDKDESVGRRGRSPAIPHLGRLLCHAMDGAGCRTFTPVQQWLVFGPLVYSLYDHFYLKRRGRLFHPHAWALTHLTERIGNRRMASMLLHIAGGTSDSYDIIHSQELRYSARPSYVAKGYAAQSIEEYNSYELSDIGELLHIELASMREDGLVAHGEDGYWRLGPGVPPMPSFAGEPWLIDVNTADEVSLKALPGVGAKLAQTLIADRAERGRFGSARDLLRLPGLKPELVLKMCPYLLFPEA